jgi:drug/metabolite transporter (DMT)-like permease
MNAAAGVPWAAAAVGLQTLPAAKAALLFACFPLLTLLVAAALGHERLSLRKSLGVAFTLGGMAVALGPQLSTTGWAAAVFIGTSSGIGYFLGLWALRHAPASKVALYLSLSPLTAMLLGGLLLHEPLSPALVVALLLVVPGLWVAQDRRP